MASITLPLYLQKQIIKILCKHINRNNKLVDLFGRDGHYRKNDKSIRNLMLLISLVSRDWFKTLSDNLYVSVDFNYKDYDIWSSESDKYSIIKKENIRILKIHYNHQNKQIYEMIKGEPKEMVVGFVYNKIETLSKLKILKTIIYRNVNYRQSLTDLSINNTKDTSITDLIDKCSSEGTCKIKLFEIFLNRTTSLKWIEKLGKTVKSIFSIIVNSCRDEQVMKKAFQLWSKKLISIDIDQYLPSEGTLFPIYQFLSTPIGIPNDKKKDTACYLSNVEVIGITDPKITIKDFIDVMKSTRFKLKTIRINICYHNLIYFLSTPQDRENDTEIRRCECDGIVKNSFLTNYQDQEQLEFNHDWGSLKELFVQHKTLETVSLNFECEHYGGVFDRTTTKFPDSFTKEVASLISNCKSLKHFTLMSSITTSIFRQILENNNTTIIDFEGSAINNTCDFEKNISEINALTSKYQHIQSFTFIKHTFEVELANYKSAILLEYKK